MNVASLELCTELYELSGWETDEFSVDFGSGYVVTERKPMVQRIKQEHKMRGGELTITPLYDLGYLLRKLPAVYEEPSGVKWILKLEISDGLWDCYYVGSAAPKTLADTPEDAACKLAIELIRQGVLTGLVPTDSEASND